MKLGRKYVMTIAIALLSLIGVAALLIWGEREDRLHEGSHPNTLAKYILIGIWQDESKYMSEHHDFARSLSKLKSSNRVDFHSIEFVESESNSQIVVYRAIPDSFNWLFFQLNTYSIGILRPRSYPIHAEFLICSATANSYIVPKIETSISPANNSHPVLKCSKGSNEVFSP